MALSSRETPRSPFLTVVKIYLQETLVYRFDLVIGLLRTFILVLVFRALWGALYGQQGAYLGVSIASITTYAVLSLVINPLFSNSLIMETNDRIRTGNIVFDISRPLAYGDLLLFQTIGKSLVRFGTASLPLFVVAAAVLRIQLPASPWVWLAFLVSFCLGFLIAFYVDFTVSLSAFWLTEISGIRFAKWSLTDLLAGVYIPLWLFPTPFKEIALALPFRGINYTPLSILVGNTPLAGAPAELAFQLLWVAALFGLSRLVFAAVVRKLAIQGG
jgi:ABC-2 type transport system permease protein